ncbi:MAG: sterol desaturase family protein [Smithella sp.]
MSIDTEVISNEYFIRIVFFLTIFGLVSISELFRPKRNLSVSKPKRWINNILFFLCGTILLRLIFPLFPVGFALICAKKGWGLFNYYHFPFSITLIAGIILLDLTIYLQHMAFHLTPVFWRMHKVHHIDQDIDVTTGLRFHPLEFMVSMIIKLTAVGIIGAPVLSVLIYEISLNGTTMFNHANLNIPQTIDRLIRLFIVTPDMHRVHHSVIVKETNSNYGFNFPWWDRIFGTYRAQPEAGHQQMKIGLNGYHDLKYQQFMPMLIIPFTARREY